MQHATIPGVVRDALHILAVDTQQPRRLPVKATGQLELRGQNSVQGAPAACIVNHNSIAPDLEKEACFLCGAGIPPPAARVRFVRSLRVSVGHKLKRDKLPQPLQRPAAPALLNYTDAVAAAAPRS
jgi:hypothetical protein